MMGMNAPRNTNADSGTTSGTPNFDTATELDFDTHLPGLPVSRGFGTHGGVVVINERAAEEFYKRGQEAEGTGQHEKAVEFYERALGENPDHEQAVFRLAVLYDRRADDAKAIELYERICTSEPVHLNALINLALLYEDNNHYDEAHRCLDAVLKTNPNHARARMYMKDVESARSMYYDDDDRRSDWRDRSSYGRRDRGRDDDDD